MMNVKQLVEQDLGCVHVMTTAAGTYAEFWSHRMTAYWERIVNGSGMILKMHLSPRKLMVCMFE